MEGLIKGLLDVALGDGGHNRNNNNNNGDEESNSQSRDERSRSSWAEVVSGDQEDNNNQEQGWKKNNNRKEVREDEDWPNVGNSNSRRPQKGGGDDDDWQNVGGRHSRRPQKDSYGELEHESSNRYEDKSNQWNRKEENEGNDGGWETVGKRPEKRPQKIWMGHSQGYKRPPTEQEYGNEVEYGSSIEPSEEELMDLSQACSKLWELDSNRLTPGKDYEIVCGKGKKTYQKEDVAQGSLFDWLSEDVFKKPTYSRFCSLLDNYNPVVGSKEEVTSQERQEQAAFIEEISRTAPIKYLHKYLTLKGVVSESPQDFKRLMTELWFALCGRGGCASSSAFEHVFVGEIKTQGEDQVSGFHNWLQFYLEEAKGRVDYQGYIYPRRRGEIPDSETQLLTIQFEWNGVLKNLSSTLVGVSPEFEIALYTLCFFMGGEDNHVQIGPYSVNIRCYRLGNDKIGSAFPIAEA